MSVLVAVITRVPLADELNVSDFDFIPEGDSALLDLLLDKLCWTVPLKLRVCVASSLHVRSDRDDEFDNEPVAVVVDDMLNVPVLSSGECDRLFELLCVSVNFATVLLTEPLICRLKLGLVVNSCENVIDRRVSDTTLLVVHEAAPVSEWELDCEFVSVDDLESPIENDFECVADIASAESVTDNGSDDESVAENVIEGDSDSVGVDDRDSEREVSVLAVRVRLLEFVALPSAPDCDSDMVRDADLKSREIERVVDSERKLVFVGVGDCVTSGEGDRVSMIVVDDDSEKVVVLVCVELPDLVRASLLNVRVRLSWAVILLAEDEAVEDGDSDEELDDVAVCDCERVRGPRVQLSEVVAGVVTVSDRVFNPLGVFRFVIVAFSE